MQRPMSRVSHWSWRGGPEGLSSDLGQGTEEGLRLAQQEGCEQNSWGWGWGGRSALTQAAPSSDQRESPGAVTAQLALRWHSGIDS